MNKRKIIVISILIIFINFLAWIIRTNKCNMSLNLIDLLIVTEDILKENNIHFWLNCGINNIDILHRNIIRLYQK